MVALISCQPEVKLLKTIGGSTIELFNGDDMSNTSLRNILILLTQFRKTIS